MGRLPEITFGRATADTYDPATHGDDPCAYIDRCLAEADFPGLDRMRVHTAFVVRLAILDLERPEPPPPADDRPKPAAGEIVIDESPQF